MQLRAQSHQVHHQISEDLAEPDHRAGRERVEDELGGSPCLEAGRAGHHFRSHDGIDDDVARLGEHFGRHRARQQDGCGAERLCLAQCGTHIRRRTARRDSHYYVAICDFGRVHRRHPRVHIVLGALGALHERGIAAGDHPRHHRRRHAERGRAFGGIEDAQTAGRAGADVDEPTTGLERGDDQVDGTGNLLALPLHHARNSRVLGIHDVHDLETRGDVDALRARGRGNRGLSWRRIRR